MSVKAHKQNAITGAEIRAMTVRVEALMNRATKDGLTASSIEMRATTIGALAEMMKTSACALGALSETVTPEAAMQILTEMQHMFYELSKITIERAKEIAAEHGFKLEVFDPMSMANTDIH